MNDVEKLVAFNNVRSFLNDDDQKELLKKLNLNEENLNTRLRGFNVETEFFLILHSLESCKDILSFDEGTSVLTNSYTPDTCLILKNDEKIFVEIKSKEDFQYKISGGNLQKRIDFADSFGFKLFFAVKLKSFWGLYSSDYLKSKNGKLTFPDDYNNSEFENVFDSKLIVLPKGIKIESYYSKTKDHLAGIHFPKYGNLFMYKFYFEDKLILDVNKENEHEAVYSIALEALHDEISKQSHEVKDLGNGETLVTEKLINNVFLYDYNFLLAHIYHTQSELGYIHDTTSFYKNIISQKGEKPISKEILSYILSDLKQRGVPIIISTLKDVNH
jgi:Holliday junction resolvase